MYSYIYIYYIGHVLIINTWPGPSSSMAQKALSSAINDAASPQTPHEPCVPRFYGIHTTSFKHRFQGGGLVNEVSPLKLSIISSRVPGVRSFHRKFEGCDLVDKVAHHRHVLEGIKLFWVRVWSLRFAVCGFGLGCKVDGS